MPTGSYARIAGRSGLAQKMITTGGGVVDRDYRGEIKVVMYNMGGESYFVNKGDRIAQMIFERILDYGLTETDALTETSRGEFGFGSTGF
jgi:dUTP pyrophosphatase